MIIAKSDNAVKFDVIEHLRDICLKDIIKVPETLLDIMTDHENTPQDRMQAAGMFTHIATFNSANNMFVDAPLKIQLIGKSNKRQ